MQLRLKWDSACRKFSLVIAMRGEQELDDGLQIVFTAKFFLVSGPIAT
jgi:hypothetical protein